jgi:thiol-disulfide isomerase/thioredoxin
MNIPRKLTEYRRALTMFSGAIGIGIILSYALCDTSCSYLQGDIFGIDLKYIGIGYMLAIIVLAAFRQMAYVRALLASGIGVEIYLIAYQFVEGVFCPFCLSFAAIVIIAFAFNYNKPLARENGWFKRILYGLGDDEFPPLFGIRIPLLILVFLGYLFVMLTFSGSTIPAYGAEKSSVPTYGAGPYELIVFTDYFCPPCQSMESEIDPALGEFLSRGGIRVTFVDVPLHKQTKVYVKYFLYVAKSARNYKDILHARRVLFSIAKHQGTADEESLAKLLKAQGVAFEPYDLKPTYEALNKIIQMYKVNSTPTCIVKYSTSDIRRYSGTFQIRNGLAMLRASQKRGEKTK